MCETCEIKSREIRRLHAVCREYQRDIRRSEIEHQKRAESRKSRFKKMYSTMRALSRGYQEDNRYKYHWLNAKRYQRWLDKQPPPF